MMQMAFSSGNESPHYNQDVENTEFMTLALQEAKKSPPKPSNFCVGAVLISHNPSTSPPSNTVLSTGYTLEYEGNTHAEQCCFLKLSSVYSCTESNLGLHLPDLPEHVWLYTTMEPCNQRSVGNVPCVDRILGLRRRDGRCAVEKVLVGVLEPGTFVGVNEGWRRLEEAGVEVVKVEGSGLVEEILSVAAAGHEKG